jgi:hypothetical protein
MVTLALFTLQCSGFCEFWEIICQLVERLLLEGSVKSSRWDLTNSVTGTQTQSIDEMRSFR